jgi:hypothetical protein
MKFLLQFLRKFSFHDYGLSLTDIFEIIILAQKFDLKSDAWPGLAERENLRKLWRFQ